MKLRDKLFEERPDCVRECFLGGCEGCPNHYGYEEHVPCGDVPSNEEMCRACWDRDESECEKGGDEE